MKNCKKQAQSLIEYGLILALVAIIALTVLSKFGKVITDMGNKTSTTVSGVSDNATKNYCVSINCTGYDETNGQCTGCK